MLKIALGCDHRGCRIAAAIVTGALFCEKSASIPGDRFRQITIKDGLDNIFFGEASTGNPFSWVGAVLITGEQDTAGHFHGTTLEKIDIPTMIPSIQNMDDTWGESRELAVQRVDYPDVGAAVAQRVSDGTVDFGILICGTGIGMCVVANKFRNVRAAVCHNEPTAELSRRHNNANVLCIPGEMLGEDTSVALVRKFLTTHYDGGRHELRIQKIAAIEKKTGL